MVVVAGQRSINARPLGQGTKNAKRPEGRKAKPGANRANLSTCYRLFVQAVKGVSYPPLPMLCRITRGLPGATLAPCFSLGGLVAA